MPTQDPRQIINHLIQTDPEIQRVIQQVWGNTTVDQRPSDTPKNLERANDRASKQIKQILSQRGINLPDRTFINPRTSSVEGMHGWAGLPPAAKIAIMGAAALTGVGAAGALGAFGGAAAGGAGAAGAGTAAVPGLAATSGLGSLAGIGTTVGGLSIPGATAAGLLGSTSLASSAALPFAGGAGNLAGVGGAAASSGGLLGGARRIGGNLLHNLVSGNGLSTLGQGLGAISQSQANNRGTALDAMMEADKMRIASDKDRRDSEADLMKKMQQTQYIGNGGANYAPATSVSGKPLGQFDFGVRPSTEKEMGMAKTLEGQLQDRLDHPPTLSDYNSKMEPGKTESALNWLGPIATVVGAARGGNSYQPPANAPRR